MSNYKDTSLVDNVYPHKKNGKRYTIREDKKTGLCGLFADKEEIVPCEYDEIMGNLEPMIVIKGDKKGLIDCSGRFIIPCEYDWIANLPPSDHPSLVRKGKLWGAINEAGEIVIPFEYDKIWWQHDFVGYTVAEKEGKTFCFDDAGNSISPATVWPLGTHRNLSKSRYTQFRSCEKALWLGTNKPEEAMVDAATEARFKTGTEVGILAKGLLGEFKDMSPKGDPWHSAIDNMLLSTKFAIKDGIINICEAAFLYNGKYCAVDILHKVDGGYEIYEVKSSTDAGKEIYAQDVAFQKYVLTKCGLNIVGTYLVCINNEYVRQGDIDIHQLFKIEDISEAVNAEYPNVEANIDSAVKVLEGPEPDKPLSTACLNPYKCAFWQYCTRNVPKPSVLNLYKMDWADRFENLYNGRITFEDVRDMDLSAKQRMQVECTLNGATHINKEGIKSFLDTLTYPLYHLDFESIMPAIPLYDGTRPYQQLPTQYSLHIQKEPCGELTHKEFLAPSKGNPLRPIAEALCRDIPTGVSVLVYNKAFECTRLRELAEMFPDLADHLFAIRDNVKDLLVPFSKGYYYLPAMGGSFSIKSVLPALFPNDPELDYHALDDMCQNGGDAMTLFPKLQDMSPEDEEKARRALLNYCHLDTLAMVRVLDKLYEAVE